MKTTSDRGDNKQSRHKSQPKRLASALTFGHSREKRYCVQEHIKTDDKPSEAGHRDV